MQPLHASAVAFDGRGVLIIGTSGSGKSTLALELMGLGGVLVADDRVILSRKGDELWLDAPEPLRNRIEARGIGVLTCASAPACACVVVDLDHVETNRLPEPRRFTLHNVELPLLRKVESPAFAAMLRVYLAEGPKA